MDDIGNDIMKAFCIVSNIENDIDIDDIDIVRYLVNDNNFVKEISDLKLIKYINGNNKKYFINDKKIEYDLIIYNSYRIKHISNYIGNLKKMDFCNIFNIKYMTNDDIKIKEYILENPKEILLKYHKNLFKNNTIIMILYSKTKYNMYIFNDFDFKYKIDDNKISFTKTIDNWNISNTIKYNNITIGNFLIEKNIKFIFNLNKYINILNRLDII